jgi:hypothetical protein
MLQIIIAFFTRILTNPRVEAFAIVSVTQLIKKYMAGETITPKEEEVETVAAIQAKQPLNLPRGSVRAILTLIMMLVVGGSFIWHYTVPEEFYALTIFAIGYYVGYRTDNTQLPAVQ